MGKRAQSRSLHKTNMSVLKWKARGGGRDWMDHSIAQFIAMLRLLMTQKILGNVFFLDDFIALF